MAHHAERLPVSEKFGYSLGDCAANFVFQTQIMFLLAFYTDVLGIAASTAGYIFLFSRFWDAFNDPMMGALADRTKSRWGKFRPWIFFTAAPFAVFFVLAYTAPELSNTGKVIWAIVTYNALMMIYTANNIPYSALTGVMTGDMAERASLVTWRFVFAMIAQFLVQTFTLVLVGYFGGDNQALGYQLTMGMWAVIAVVFFFITFAATRERVQPDPAQKTSPLRDIADLFNNINWVVLALATVFVFMCLSMRGSVTYYYFQYFVTREQLFNFDVSWQSLFGMFNGLGTLTTIVGVLLSKPLCLRFGKRNVYIAGLFLTALVMAAFVFLPPTATEAMIGMQMLLQIIYGVTIPLLWSMMADVADYCEWQFGRRATAMTFATTMFALKLGLSFGGALAGWLLDLYGYVPNVEQTEESLRGIVLMMSVYPALAFLIAVCILFVYRINKNMELEMQDDLLDRRANVEVSTTIT